jgi:hypothetical protein
MYSPFRRERHVGIENVDGAITTIVSELLLEPGSNDRAEMLFLLDGQRDTAYNLQGHASSSVCFSRRPE